MVYFCEINKTDAEHAMVNRSLLGILREAYPEEEIRVYMSLSHLDATGIQNVTDKNLTIQTIPVLSPLAGNKKRWIHKLWSEAKTLKRILKQFQKAEGRLLFFSSLSPLGAKLLSLYARRYRISGQILATLHGELQLLSAEPTKKIDRFYASCLRQALSASVEGLRWLVLGDAVKAKLIDLGLASSDKCISIPHPLREPLPLLPPKSPKPLVFGHIGVAKQAKLSPLFFAWAEELQAEISKGNVRFILAGPVLQDMKGYTNTWVEHSPTDQFLSDEAFQAACQQMHYAVFLYEDAQYGLISSGAITEAISFEIPILAVKSVQIERLFAQVPHAPGKIYPNKEALQADLPRLMALGAPDPAMILGIRQLKALYDIPSLAKLLKDQIDTASTHG